MAPTPRSRPRSRSTAPARTSPTTTGDCYSFEAKAGMTVRTYNVCWAEGKINKVEDKGMR